MEYNTNTRKALQLRALQLLQEKDALEAEVEAKFARLRRRNKSINPVKKESNED